MVPVYPYLRKETQCKSVPIAFPPQEQLTQPGLETLMNPRPIFENPSYCGSGKLSGKTAVVTGGDSGIGRAVACAFAKEGADLVIPYLCEERDARETKCWIENLGRRCLLIPGDLGQRSNTDAAVEKAVGCFGKVDVLVNNQAVQFVQESILDISAEQLETTFRTNVFATFYMIQAALPHMKRGSAIINTTSVTAYHGEPKLIDYSATKGALAALTRSLALSLAPCGIRVNGVAPGPIWTPLIPSSFSAREVAAFGTQTSPVPMRRAGQPFELAPAYVYLASDDSSYMTGQVLHPNGGTIVNG